MESEGRRAPCKISGPTAVSSMTRPLRTLLAGIAATAACGESGNIPRAVVRDSAGITIVDNSAFRSVDLDAWTLSPAPTLKLGSFDGLEVAEQFNSIVGATRLGDGSIVIADGGSRELRFFDRDGTHTHTVGGSGEGPGELGRLFSLDRIHGDTLVANDWPVGNAAWFTVDGAFVFNSMLGPYWPGLTGHFLPDGSLLADTYGRRSYGNEIENWAVNGPEDYFRPDGWMVRALRDSTIDTLRSVVGEEWFRRGVWRQDLWIQALPFAHNTRVAWNADRIFVGETERREIEAVDYEGNVTMLIRWDSDPVPLTADDRDEFESFSLNRARQNRQAHVRRWLDVITYPEVKPAFKELTTDLMGRLYIRNWEAAGSATVDWRVFGTDGRLLARLTVPTDIEILEIGDDYVIALWKDDLDVEFVRVYGVDKDGRDAARTT